MSTGIGRRSIGYSLAAILTIMLIAGGGVAAVAPTASALDNGVAVTPPMGWNSWNYFHCNVSEDKIKSAADEIVSNGMKEAGYEYIIVDDCWMTDKRDANGVLQSDPKTFPSGMKSLGDYIHSKGLKFGIYQSPTQGTCQKRPGSYGYEELDAQTFADWGVDYLKYDWCQTTPDESPQIWKDNPGLTEKQIAQKLFTRMSEALKKTDRPIVYSLSACCSALDFPEWAGDVSNLWRTSGDIAPTWRSITANYRSAVGLYAAAGPGRWNDPDMLEVGVKRHAGEGLTDVEAALISPCGRSWPRRSLPEMISPKPPIQTSEF